MGKPDFDLMIDDKCLGKFSTLIHEHVKVDNVDFLYHLITDNFKLEIEDTTFEDYYATLENIIDFRDEIKELKSHQETLEEDQELSIKEIEDLNYDED